MPLDPDTLRLAEELFQAAAKVDRFSKVVVRLDIRDHRVRLWEILERRPQMSEADLKAKPSVVD